jgi:hypothetical protein
VLSHIFCPDSGVKSCVQPYLFLTEPVTGVMHNTAIFH